MLSNVQLTTLLKLRPAKTSRGNLEWTFYLEKHRNKALGNRVLQSCRYFYVPLQHYAREKVDL